MKVDMTPPSKIQTPSYSIIFEPDCIFDQEEGDVCIVLCCALRDVGDWEFPLAGHHYLT